MKKLLLIALLAASYDVSGQSITEIDTAAYFDFWVGEWYAAWDEGNGVEQLGTNTITKSLDDKVIIENFKITGGKNAGFKGTSITVYQAQFKRWKQAWADNAGGYFDFEGDFEGEKRIFKTQIMVRNGKKIQQRMVFYNITANSMTWDWELSADGSQSFQLQWRIFYTKKL